ncbi:M90 family metallopeptidase [Enhygromyxa salina]|uniref:Protein MtfA n=1 Tax=Enhygromyxa salina TaxID=215803 RepID=A0A2S9XC81_9BACT|nr:M90 family metallopeptidase [Enhygromyxa salina]PRP90410.1 Protein MtfA [Enhygromyxa salina]
MQVWPANKIRVHLGVALSFAALGLIGALASAWSWPNAVVGAVVGAVLGAGWYLWMAGTYHRRRSLVSTPFPAAWRQILERRVDFYRRLPVDGEARRRFEDDVRIFLAEQNIYGAGQGARQLEIDDETRLLIASSAAILGHGMPKFEWPRLRDIVVHPRAFDEDYASEDHANITGMVHYQGPILYSERDLALGFRRHDGHNVGLHELAHVLDMADGHVDGVPIGAAWASSAPWLEVITDRLRKLRTHRYANTLRDYAGTNEAEFFAVAVETFFERPHKLRDKDPELYAMLRDYFGQDPGAS